MTTIQSGVRFRAYPLTRQALVLRRWIGCQRYIYNAKVGEDRLFAAQRRMILRDNPGIEVRTPLDRLYGQFKSEEMTPWLSHVPSQILREGTYRWFNAKQRQLKGLAKAPTRRNRSNFNSVLLTSDLFSLEGDRLILGTPKFPLGELQFNAHREYGAPKMISISESGGRWFVSFSYEHEIGDEIIRSSQELAHELNLLSDDELAASALGIDRNVADNCAADSHGQFYKPDSVCLDRIARKEIGARRQQRRLARCKKGSANRKKAAASLARKLAYKADVLRDFAHKSSHAFVNSGVKLIALEDLKVAAMVHRPKPKQDDQGRWIKNGAAAKAGLNKSILDSAWGRIRMFTQYKAERRNILVVLVRPQFSSQECSRCGHTHPENRHGAKFLCQRCGHAEHADTNASKNILARGIERVRSGELEKRTKAIKRVAVKRKSDNQNKTGSVRPGVSVERLQDATPGVMPGSVAQGAAKQKAFAARQDAPTTAPTAFSRG